MVTLKDGIPAGSGSRGNVAGSMLSGVVELAGLGMTLGALGGVMEIAKDVVSPMMETGKKMRSVVNQSINPAQASSNMITCLPCGNRLPKRAKFCMERGTKLQ